MAVPASPLNPECKAGGAGCTPASRDRSGYRRLTTLPRLHPAQPGGPVAVPDAEALIRRIQAAHPSDFWANFALAEPLDLRKDADAIGYHRAAIALRPEAAVTHFNLAIALKAQDRADEAIESMRRAAALDPSSWPAHFNLVAWLMEKRQFEEALGHSDRSAAIAGTPRGRSCPRGNPQVL
jgi:tetratricopeptide (TPR) repeat protein